MVSMILPIAPEGVLPWRHRKT